MQALLHVILIILAFSTLLPFIHVLAASITRETPLRWGLLPVGVQWRNYRYLLEDRTLLHTALTSLARVVLGVLSILGVTALTAYPLSQDRLPMPGRAAFKVALLIGMLFDGGLIPYFLTLRNLGLLDKFAVLIIPTALKAFYIIITINFFRGLPVELSEAAMLDGGTHFDVLWRVYLPMSRPVLATVTLFAALDHWNAWFDGVIFLKRVEQWPLQSYLYSRITTRMLQWSTSGDQGIAAANIMLVTAPILAVYLFLQRYFITGLTLGSLKG